MLMEWYSFSVQSQLVSDLKYANQLKLSHVILILSLVAVDINAQTLGAAGWWASEMRGCIAYRNIDVQEIDMDALLLDVAQTGQSLRRARGSSST